MSKLTNEEEPRAPGLYEIQNGKHFSGLLLLHAIDPE